MWLYTRSAEALYARIGWRTVESFAYRGKAYALMRRDLPSRSRLDQLDRAKGC